ncbi:scavenger receptor cysteine-rich type 1 protein M130-like [Polyodon spathula]|uniref:scavenger receptor cysteine-rich type 1 protein M130-like n=1 Tax=Polyodon spathula TaxID=7913 RepID=UPI001B7EE388|nr:scavenger receptor cysteine-rich type 1 protein M130-like [Polyodon spathula]
MSVLNYPCRSGAAAQVNSTEPSSGSAVTGSTQLRLNGSSPCAGRVEVLYNGHWGRVCSHSWDLPDAEVVCKQLGCGAAVSAPHSKRPDGLPEDRVLNSVGCLGTESQLRECKSAPWGRKDCQHGWDAAVICAESQEGKEALEKGGKCI